jgi:3-deoxy-D-manno-octulosonate 8-phosphate phosphatase KdsC-like HAD superfamily phosphatase
MLVERWEHQEGLDLSSREVSRIATAVEARIAAGDRLADLPMWELAIGVIVEDATGVLASVGDGVDTDDVPDSVMESVVDMLMDNREAMSFDKLPELARGLFTDWADAS